MELSTNASLLPSPVLLQPPKRQQQPQPPMEESEKLTALKKAYAEIILNTTKEASVRLMESERKAVRFQQELLSVKEESLCMLMRLKQMLDAKNNEAEIASMNQQKKIEELEAQLHEAEDIVKELREELREVQAQLDQAKTTQSQAELREELVAVSNAEILSSDRIYKGSNDCSEDSSYKGYCYFPNPDFASIIRRCKEPKLHRNGCTQRIRACKDNLCKEAREETCKRGNEEGDHPCGTMEPSYSNRSKMVCMENSIAYFEAAWSIRRKRKQATRYSKGKASSFVNLLSHAEETQHASCSKNSQDEDKTFMQLDIASIKQSGNRDKGFVKSQSNRKFRNPLNKGFAEIMNLPDDAEDTRSPCCSKDLLEEDKTIVQSEISTVKRWSDTDKGLVESQVERESNEPEKVSGLSHCAADCEKLKGSSLNSDLKALGHDDGVPGQSPDSKFLKYTFQRKRKREISCSPEPNSRVNENDPKQNMVEKCSGSLDPKSLSFTTESSWDSRRLVQVAHQLISLSEKKW